MRPFRVLLLLMTACCLLSTASLCALEPPATTWSSTVTVTDTAEPQPKVMKHREGGFRWRDLRKMGLKLRDVRRAYAELQAEGIVTEDMTRTEVSIVLASRLMETTPQSFQDPSFDMDSFIAFIEALIPLIQLLISLFSYDMPLDAILPVVYNLPPPELVGLCPVAA